jgi:hypothetical protein
VRATDPTGDVRSNTSAGTFAGFDGIDLTSAVMAEQQSTLCIAFTTKAARTPSSDLFIFDLRARGSGDSGALVRIAARALNASVVYLSYPGADQTPSRGAVNARVQVDGQTTTVTIQRSVLPTWAPFASFQWDALGLTQNGPSTEMYDCAPDGADILYPEGTPATAPAAAHCTL